MKKSLITLIFNLFFLWMTIAAIQGSRVAEIIMYVNVTLFIICNMYGYGMWDEEPELREATAKVSNSSIWISRLTNLAVIIIFFMGNYFVLAALNMWMFVTEENLWSKKNEKSVLIDDGEDFGWVDKAAAEGEEKGKIS